MGDRRPEFSEIRKLFPITDTRSYLYAGGMAPISLPARVALVDWVDRWLFDPGYHKTDFFPDWRTARIRFATLIGAHPDEIAVTDSTSRGNNLAAQMIEASAGSNVVVDATTYPSALYPWLQRARRDVEIRRATSQDEGLPSITDFERLVNDETVAITVSHVCRLTGFRHDLAALGELAHSRGAYLVVDAAQSAGAVEIDVAKENIDFLACGGMKWLLGAPGVGFLFVRRDLAEALTPPQLGPLGLVQKQLRPEENDEGIEVDDLRAGAGRHELSTGNWAGIAATVKGMEILLSVGMDRVAQRVRDLSSYLITGLLTRGVSVRTPLDDERHAGVVAFTVENPEELRLFLRNRGVDVWGFPEDNRMRADPHIYNDESDVDRLFEGIDDFARIARSTKR